MYMYMHRLRFFHLWRKSWSRTYKTVGNASYKGVECGLVCVVLRDSSARGVGIFQLKLVPFKSTLLFVLAVLMSLAFINLQPSRQLVELFFFSFIKVSRVFNVTVMC